MKLDEAITILEEYNKSRKEAEIKLNASEQLSIATDIVLNEIRKIHHRKTMYPEGYKQYHIPKKYYSMLQWGDHGRIERKYKISKSTLVKSFKKGTCTYRTLKAFEDYFKNY